MERRRLSNTQPSSLPTDYLKMIAEIFTSRFDSGLQILKKYQPHSQFEAFGSVFSNEIVLSVSLGTSGKTSATTVHASVDFDPKVASPHAQDLLCACVDAIDSIFNALLSPEKPEIIAKLSESSLIHLDEIPFDWTLIETHQNQIFIKLDKSNPKLDALTEKWLSQNDPHLLKLEDEKEKETENLFFTGPKHKKNTDPGFPH